MVAREQKTHTEMCRPSPNQPCKHNVNQASKHFTLRYTSEWHTSNRNIYFHIIYRRNVSKSLLFHQILLYGNFRRRWRARNFTVKSESTEHGLAIESIFMFFSFFDGATMIHVSEIDTDGDIGLCSVRWQVFDSIQVDQIDTKRALSNSFDNLQYGARASERASVCGWVCVCFISYDAKHTKTEMAWVRWHQLAN